VFARPPSFALVALVALAVAAPPPGAAQAKLSVAPSLANFEAQPGNRATERMRIGNEGDDDLKLAITIRDIDHDDTGKRNFYPVGTTGASCGRWLASLPPTLDLPARSAVNLELVAKIPKNTSPGTYACAVLSAPSAAPSSAANKARKGRNASIGIMPSVGTIIIINVLGEGLDRSTELEIIDGYIRPPTASLPLMVKLQVSNTSGWYARPTGVIAFFDAKGAAIGTTNMPTGGIFPKRSAWFESTFPTVLPPGDYRMLVNITDKFGGTASADFSFAVDPPVAKPPPAAPAPKPGAKPKEPPRGASKPK